MTGSAIPDGLHRAPRPTRARRVWDGDWSDCITATEGLRLPDLAEFELQQRRAR